MITKSGSADDSDFGSMLSSFQEVGRALFNILRAHPEIEIEMATVVLVSSKNPVKKHPAAITWICSPMLNHVRLSNWSLLINLNFLLFAKTSRKPNSYN